MADPKHASSPSRHIDRILELVDRALGLDAVPEPAPVYFDPRPPEPSPARRR
ncbi:MAG TPA: hypothetical protein VM618_07320 [Acidimicrobiia bacterium]|nr:hypothetical protein [Acidimicrobiia bacterium]